MKSLKDYVKEALDNQKYAVTVEDDKGNIDPKQSAQFDDEEKAKKYFDDTTKKHSNNPKMKVTLNATK